MNTKTKLTAAVVIAGVTSLASMSAAAWWGNDRYRDRWYDGPWYGGGYPGYGWGGYPGYGWGGFPGYGWGGYSGQGKTIIVTPQISDKTDIPVPEPKLPR